MISPEGAAKQLIAIRDTAKALASQAEALLGEMAREPEVQQEKKVPPTIGGRSRNNGEG